MGGCSKIEETGLSLLEFTRLAEVTLYMLGPRTKSMGRNGRLVRRPRRSLRPRVDEQWGLQCAQDMY